VRAANNGISAAVDGYGRILARLDLDARGTIDVALPAAVAAAALRALGGLLFLCALAAGRAAGAPGLAQTADAPILHIGIAPLRLTPHTSAPTNCRSRAMRTGRSCREHPVSSTRGGRRKGLAGRPNPIDVHVGGRVRFRRMLLGMSQERLGEKLGLTFQQIQKYEKGINRIGASRLFDLAQVLGVPVQFFYEEAPAAEAKHLMPDGFAERPLTTPSSNSCAAATDSNSTRRSCAFPTPRRDAPSSIWSAVLPTTTSTTPPSAK
jgi:transcriptional regulator with XRE-family HTH domain